ncbi:MAG: carbohydrate-binding protein, partial [Spirochaetales bacterium]|nr:carbohydrate-binding protein [Spirochaetales bacterium]
TVPVTGGWQSWTTVSGPIGTLSSGNHVIRLSAGTNGFNINWFNIIPGTVSTSTPGPTPTPTRGTVTGGRYHVLTWIAAYNVNQCLTNLNASYGGAWNPRNVISAIGAQFYLVNSNGTISQNVSETDMQRVKSFCNSNGIKFLLTIFNYDGSWNWGRAASAFGPNRTAHVNNLIAELQRVGADGIDIDYEGNLAGDPNRAEFGTFMRELGGRLHSMGKMCTVDVFSSIWNQPNVNWFGDWTGYVDMMNSMGYGALYGGGSGWNSFNYQLNAALSAGYQSWQMDVGFCGTCDSWGSGGLGTSIVAHVNEVMTPPYSNRPMSICFWDANWSNGWRDPAVWEALHRLRTLQ